MAKCINLQRVILKIIEYLVNLFDDDKRQTTSR